MLKTEEKNPLSGLTIEEQEELSRKEAKKFDKQRFEQDSELTIKERKKQKERIDNLKLSQEREKEEYRKNFDSLVSDPLEYLRQGIEEGEYQGREQRFQLALLVVLCKIEKNLAELLKKEAHKGGK